MYGSGILKALAMTLHHFAMTSVAAVRARFRRRSARDSVGSHSLAERPESTACYHGLPRFVIDAQTEQLRCTACGICAQICPVQCIWIQRAKDPRTGRPQRYPITYYLDTTLCMRCGYCVEFCPFEALTMDQEPEPVSYRRPGFVSARQPAKPEPSDSRIRSRNHVKETQPKSSGSNPDS
jgi:NADH-quinone oxidoreductase subunit I